MQRNNRKRWIGLGAVFGAGVAAVVVAGLGVFAAQGVAASADKPDNTSPPTISGTPQEGKTLTGDKGKWDNNPSDYNYYWLRCDKTGGSCSTISGATDQKYKLKSVDIGNTLRLRVQAKNGDGTTVATSVPTGVVTKAEAAAPPASNKGTCSSKSGTASVKDIELPIRLLVDKWDFTPNVVVPGTSNVVARIHVADTCGHSVSGAQVWGTAIPYNQVSVEQSTTDSSGYATLTFRVKSGFPANPGKQQIMAMLIRASDSSENALAGKSTRRVLSLAVNS